MAEARALPQCSRSRLSNRSKRVKQPRPARRHPVPGDLGGLRPRGARRLHAGDNVHRVSTPDPPHGIGEPRASGRHAASGDSTAAAAPAAGEGVGGIPPHDGPPGRPTPSQLPAVGARHAGVRVELRHRPGGGGRPRGGLHVQVGGVGGGGELLREGRAAAAHPWARLRGPSVSVTCRQQSRKHHEPRSPATLPSPRQARRPARRARRRRRRPPRPARGRPPPRARAAGAGVGGGRRHRPAGAGLYRLAAARDAPAGAAAFRGGAAQGAGGGGQAFPAQGQGLSVERPARPAGVPRGCRRCRSGCVRALLMPRPAPRRSRRRCRRRQARPTATRAPRRCLRPRRRRSRTSRGGRARPTGCRRRGARSRKTWARRDGCCGRLVRALGPCSAPHLALSRCCSFSSKFSALSVALLGADVIDPERCGLNPPGPGTPITTPITKPGAAKCGRRRGRCGRPARTQGPAAGRGAAICARWRPS
jgi:hypothetical protein